MACHLTPNEAGVFPFLVADVVADHGGARRTTTTLRRLMHTPFGHPTGQDETVLHELEFPTTGHARAARCWTGPMLETPEELTALQALLDASMATAGPHLRGIISDERRLSAAQLTERLQGMRLLVLATVTADGRPLAGPVDGYFLHGTFWFSSGRHAVRMHHLAARPACSATHLPGEDLAVTVHGRAEPSLRRRRGGRTASGHARRVPAQTGAVVRAVAREPRRARRADRSGEDVHVPPGRVAGGTFPPGGRPPRRGRLEGDLGGRRNGGDRWVGGVGCADERRPAATRRQPRWRRPAAPAATCGSPPCSCG